MKNYPQVYVKNSFEAAETYCRAFGAEKTLELINEDTIENTLHGYEKTLHQAIENGDTEIALRIKSNMYFLKKCSHIFLIWMDLPMQIHTEILS